MRNIYWLVSILFFITGCAVQPVTSTQTSDSLTVSLSGAKNSKFTLVDANGNIVAEDQGDDGKLDFRIPKTEDTRSCVYIRDEKGKKLGDEQYELSLINKFRQVDRYKSEVESRHNLQSQQYSSLYKHFQDTKIKLEGHSAFSNRRCHIPIQRPLPPMPVTRCESYDECLEEGGAICYSRFIGTEGCSLALKELNVSGMLSSPGCATIAADLAGEKYDMDDAFVDFMHGVADDIAGNLIKSDSWADNIVGGIVLFTNYGIKLDKARTCTNNFVQHYYGPKIVWQQKAEEIRLEPQAIKNNCERLIGKHNNYAEQLDKASTNLQNLRTKLADLNVIHDDLSRQEILSPLCTDIRSSSWGEVGFAKRYLIGTVLENIETDDKNENRGLRVTSLIDDSPAQIAGLQIEDRIISINNVPVSDILELTREVQRSEGQQISIMLSRRNKLRSFTITPIFKQVKLTD